ncbi:MAG: hypothetical protein ABSG72_05815 [Candidatus Sulfotelmatobacter sp.]|jgi:hypothetical protein
MATLKAAVTTVVEHPPVEALRGVTDIAVGGTELGLVMLFELLHPVAKTSNRNAGNQILALLYVHMIVNLLLLGSTAAAPWHRNFCSFEEVSKRSFSATVQNCTTTVFSNPVWSISGILRWKEKASRGERH